MLKRGSRGKDVEWVQLKLNGIGQSTLVKLDPDGKFGSKTDSRVREYQRNSQLKVDGIVGPNTMSKLKAAVLVYGPELPPDYDPKKPPEMKGGGQGGTAGVAPAKEAEPEKPGSPNAPRQLPRHQIRDLKYKSHYTWEVGLFGTAKAGNIFLGPDGRRLIYEVFHTAVVYLVVKGKPNTVGKFYAQTKKGFIHDVETYTISRGAKGAKGMKTLAEFEAALLKGMAGATSVPAFLLITGIDLLEFFVKHQRKFGIYKEAIVACLHARRILKTHAPTLWDKLVQKVIFKVAPNIPSSAVNDPKIIGTMLGTLIVQVGDKAIAGKFKSLGVVFAILLQVAMSAATAVPGAGIKTAKEDGAKIIAEMRKAGVNISQGESNGIMKEIEKNPRQVAQGLKILNKAFSKIR